MRASDWLRRLIAPAPGRRRRAAKGPAHVALGLEALEERCVPAVTYGGGPLLTSVQVQAVFYGSQWGTNATLKTERTYLDGYLQYLVNSPYMDMLSNAGYGVGRGTFTAGALDSLSLGSQRDDNQIEADLTTAIDDNLVQSPGAVSNNHLYVVFVEPNVEVTMQGSNSKNDFAGYHNTYTADTTVIGGQPDSNVYYAVIAYPGGVNYGAFGLPNDPENSLTEVTSHEVAEAVTDPDVSSGWADYNTGNEIGDIVNGQATSLNSYIVQKESSKNETALIPSGALDLDVANLQLSSGSIGVNQSLTLTATVDNYTDVYGTQTNPNPFTGTVDFYDGSTVLGSGGLQSVGGVMTATFSTSALGVGTHSLKAVYRGDQHFLSSTSSIATESVSKGSTATQVGVSAVTGKSALFTATVAPGTSGSTQPGGSVNFYLDGGATPVGGGTLQLIGGVETATFNDSSLTPGPHSVVAVYQGDANFGSSPSTSDPFTVGLATGTVVTASATTTLFNQSVTFTATVTNTSGQGGAPTGAVEFFDGATDLGPGVAAGGGVWTLATTSLTVGAHTIQATFTPTGLFAGGSGTTTETVDAVTSTAVVSGGSPSLFGQSATFTATVTNTSGQGGTPTGAVEFFDGSKDLGPGVAAGGGVWSLATTSLTVGAHTIKAVYTPTGTFAGGSGTATQTVDAVTSTAVISSGSPTLFNQSVTFTATVTNTSGQGGTPTGAVEFFDGATDLGPGLAAAGGVWTLATSSLTVGAHTVKAVYTPTGTFAGGSGTATETIDAVTSTAVASGGSPSLFAQSVTFTATVTNTSGQGGAPTGAVEFFDGATDLGPGVAAGGGVWTLATTALSLGGHTVRAVYTPTGTFAGGAGTTTQTVDVATSTAVVSGGSPSLFGQSATFTATVTNTSGQGGAPTGAVEFFDGATDLGPGVAAGGGVWSLATSALTVGAHTIKAVYTPTGLFAGGSGTTPQTVDAVTSTAVASGGSPSLFAQSVTFTATVTNTSGQGGTPTGAVEFFDGATDLGPGVAAGGGVWSLATSALTVGAHTIKAVYSPTGTFAGGSGTATQTVDAVTSTAVASSLTPSTAGQAVTFTATVTNTSGQGGTPTGAVEFFDGATDLGAGVGGGGAVWTFTSSALAFGVHSVKAVYTPTGTFAGSSGTASQTVDSATFTAILHSNGSLDLLGPTGLQPLSPAGTISAVSSVTDASGNDDIFVIVQTPGFTGTLWEYSREFAAGGNPWKEISTGSFVQISAATNAQGQAVVFALPSDHSLWEQTPAGAGLDLNWKPLSPAGTIQSISAITDAAGNDDVFIVSQSQGYVGALWEHSPGFLGNPWRQLSTGSFQQISAGLDAGGQADVFAVVSNGTLWMQDPARGVGIDKGWSQVGTGTVRSVIAAGTPAEAFAIDSNGHLEQFPAVGGPNLLSAGSFASLSATVDTAGADEVFAAPTDGSFYEYAPGFPGDHFELIATSGVIAASASARHAD